MATDIFDDFNLDQNDIDTNIELYVSQSIENGTLKIKMTYPNTFFLNNNGTLNYFRLDPYNKGKVNYIGDQTFAGNAICPESSCVPALLQTLTGKTRFNNSVANLSSNDVIMNGTNYFNGSFDGLSSILFLGFNDVRINSSDTLYLPVKSYDYTKMLIDILTTLSVPTNCIIPARNMTQLTGTWYTNQNITGNDIGTNTTNASLEYTFTNKRYLYVSMFYSSSNVNASWNFFINNNFISTETNTSPSVVLYKNTLFYSSGFLIDLGSEYPTATLKIFYNATDGIEINYLNYIAGWTDTDIANNGRDVLLLGIPRIGSVYSTATDYNNLTDEKRLSIINCQKNAVKSCKLHGLNCYYLETNNLLPLGSDNLNFLPSAQKMMANDIYKYIQLSNK
jgi:hypothetical protein